MTTNDIISISRRFLQDTVSPYHWTDEELKNNLSLSIIALHKARPETRYVNGLLVDEVELPSLATDNISIDSRFNEALACYVAHLCYLDDVTDPVSAQLAESFLQKFMVRATT